MLDTLPALSVLLTVISDSRGWVWEGRAVNISVGTWYLAL